MKNRFVCAFLTVTLSTLMIDPVQALELSSSSIVGGKIQQSHACSSQGGKDQSLHLNIDQIPADAKFLAIIADDPDAMKPAGKVWVHWNVFNIVTEGSIMEFPAGVSLKGDLGRTSGGAKGYEGMCPPDGVHTYRFAVLALKDKIEVGGFFGPSAMTIDDFERKFTDKIIKKTVITGKF